MKWPQTSAGKFLGFIGRQARDIGRTSFVHPIKTAKVASAAIAPVLAVEYFMPELVDFTANMLPVVDISIGNLELEDILSNSAQGIVRGLEIAAGAAAGAYINSRANKEGHKARYTGMAQWAKMGAVAAVAGILAFPSLEYRARTALYALQEPIQPANQAPPFGKQKIRDMSTKDFGNGLLSKLTGIQGKFSDDKVVDYRHQLLDVLWAEKLRKFPNRPVIRTAFEERAKKYNQKNATTMSLDGYIAEAQRSIDIVNVHLNWDKVGEMYGLERHKLRLAKAISTSLDGRDLIAYALTELMPTTNGELNKKVFDTLLRKAGREYIELIPALYDKYASFGQYQFTSFALYSIGTSHRGASKVNQALPSNYRIPDSMIRLEGNDHHKAAYLFSIHNIASLISTLNGSNYGTLDKVWKHNKSNIVKYIATAHNRPASASKAAKRWLSNGARYDFTSSTDRHIRGYAIKTGQNWKALQR